MTFGIVLKPTGEIEDLPEGDGIQSNLKALQGAVGGYVEAVILKHPLRELGVMAWINEEGKFADHGRPLPTNDLATWLAYIGPYDQICGNMVLASASETPLTAGQIAAIREAVK